MPGPDHPVAAGRAAPVRATGSPRGDARAWSCCSRGCAPSSAPSGRRGSAGTAEAPREINVIMRDYLFEPKPIVLHRGETIRFNVFNAGLLAHELVLGDAAVQAAWATAEAAATPPGFTATPPPVSLPPDVGGLRICLDSGASASADYDGPRGRDTGAGVPDPRPHRAGDGREGQLRPRRRAIAGSATAAVHFRTQARPSAPRRRTNISLRRRPGEGSGDLRHREPCIDVLDQSCVAVCPSIASTSRGQRPEAVHRSGRVHRLRRLRARMPGERHLPRGFVARGWGQYTAVDALWYKDKAAARARSTSGSRLDETQLSPPLLAAEAPPGLDWPGAHRLPPSVRDRDRLRPGPWRRARRPDTRVRLPARCRVGAGHDLGRGSRTGRDQSPHPRSRPRPAPWGLGHLSTG